MATLRVTLLNLLVTFALVTGLFVFAGCATARTDPCTGTCNERTVVFSDGKTLRVCDSPDVEEQIQRLNKVLKDTWYAAEMDGEPIQIVGLE